MEASEVSESLIDPTDQLNPRSIDVTITTSPLDAPTTPLPVSTPESAAVNIDDRYDTNHPKHGIALIINQVKFSGMAEREGSDMDRNSISAVLIGIGFDVRVVNDPKKDDLLKMLKAIAKEDHLENDSLVVVVMTHGDKKNLLYAKDKTYKAEKLWEPFVGENCQSLLGKPKMFFIQACRGKRMDFGARVKRMIMDPKDSAASVPLNYVVPTMADLLVMYSTCDGYYAWRNTENGSWFIQSLSIELEVNAHSQDILYILTAVSRRVAYHYESNVPKNEKLHAKKQMPSIVSMLTKLLYFPSQKK